MSFLNASKSKLYFDKKSYKKLNFFLDKNEYLSSIFILVDEKTKIYCLPYLLENIPFLSKAKITILHDFYNLYAYFYKITYIYSSS